MIEMRVPFLLMLVPAVALADASTPEKRPPPTSVAVGNRTVTVGFGEDWKVHVRVAGGGELVLEPAGQAYVGHDVLNVTAALAPNVAPVPLVKVSSRPEACADYWDVYVSIVDGVPRDALELYGLADPPSMATPSVSSTATAPPWSRCASPKTRNMCASSERAIASTAASTSTYRNEPARHSK